MKVVLEYRVVQLKRITYLPVPLIQLKVDTKAELTQVAQPLQ